MSIWDSGDDETSHLLKQGMVVFSLEKLTAWAPLVGLHGQSKLKILV